MKKNNKGFFVIEAVIAMVVFAVGIIGVLHYQTSALQSSAESYNRVVAAQLGNAAIGQISLDLDKVDEYVSANKNHSGYANWLESVNTALPRATTHPPLISKKEVNGETEVTVTVRWQNPFTTVVSNHETKEVIYKNPEKKDPSATP